MDVPANLPILVKERFNAAKDSGALNFYPTQVALLPCGEPRIPFQVRFSPALAHKPKADKPKDSKKPFDPFLDPPPDLLVCELPPQHNIVLNKFAIVPEHFILATKEFKEQTHLLDEADLAAAYACLTAYRGHGTLFGFFNSGEHSGASQPHRHIQFLPVQSMKEGTGDDVWQPLAESLAAVTPAPDSELPFAYFAERLPQNPRPSELLQIYRLLYENACKAVRLYIAENPGCELQLKDEQDGSAAISYNMGLTDGVMVLCPRISEGKIIPDQEGNPVGPIALNGTVLAGTLLVKSEAEWAALKEDKSKLVSVLAAIGIPPAPHHVDGRL
ncbi:hypothetical protein BP6252_07774 [Coleophoma cylindrospora]|uniref:Uncharacterized protein n=1 Tax=Coleophoma cylindrospora TaxID=1849047 RepID=A0A3D8RBF5_9HELO|nr:hypothetical protein BP6252_07774 [Coleophoma cylindrospora]